MLLPRRLNVDLSNILVGYLYFVMNEYYARSTKLRNTYGPLAKDN